MLDRFGPATREWFNAAFAAPTAAQAGAWRAIGAGSTPSWWRRPAPARRSPRSSGRSTGWPTSPPERSGPRAAGCSTSARSRRSRSTSSATCAPRSPASGRPPARLGVPPPDITVGMRTGDTPADERRAFARTPPDILITTPESLFLLLTSPARESLRGVETVIVDEVHAVGATKRGAHLALSLERLDALLARAGPADRPVRDRPADRRDRPVPRRRTRRSRSCSRRPPRPSRSRSRCRSRT